MQLWAKITIGHARNVVSAAVGFEGSNSRAISGVGAWKNSSRRRSKIHTIDGTKLWAKWSICRKKDDALGDNVKSAEIRWWVHGGNSCFPKRRHVKRIDSNWIAHVGWASKTLPWHIFGMISTASLPYHWGHNILVLILELLPNLEVVLDKF